jgi:hypothetical protein
MATFIKRGDKYFVQIRRKGMATTCRSFHYKTDAEEWARHMEAKADRGDLPTPVRAQARYTVGNILERYRDEVIPKKRGADAIMRGALPYGSEHDNSPLRKRGNCRGADAPVATQRKLFL